MQENPLQTSLHSLTCLLDALHCGAAMVDQKRIILHANARLCSMLQRSREDLIGSDVICFCDNPQDIEKLRNIHANFAQPHQIEFDLALPDGSRLPVITASRPLPPPYESLHIVTIIDISQQKEVETRLQSNYEFLVQMSNTVLEQALDLKNYSKQLEEKVAQRTRDLYEANLDSIYMLAVACEARDRDTGEHVRRIEHYSRAIAIEMGLTEAEADRIGYSAVLHDVGKLQVPDRILSKPGPLTSDERMEMQQHTLAGEQILSTKPFFAMAREIARSHHENWDGSGYPDGLKGEQISLAARIVHVADVFDALASPRVYKPAWTIENAAREIEIGSEISFDPNVVRAFRQVCAKGLLRLDRTRPQT